MGSLIFGLLFGWLGSWANSMRGWEADVVSTIFMSAATILFFVGFMFAALLRGWYKQYPIAIREAPRHSHNVGAMQKIYKEVFGPIPWHSS